MLSLPPKTSKAVNWLRERPIAHRGLHDANKRVFENTLSAAAAAVRRDYPIELDLQPSKDRVPMVFHDEELERMTGVKGNIRDMAASELSKITIKRTREPIPTLADLLELVDGEVGLVIELKGITGADDGFAAAVVETLKNYNGTYALMSFEHHLLQDIRDIAPNAALGLAAFGEDDKYDTHCAITKRLNLDFVSYYVDQLETRFVRDYRQTKRPMVSWTVKTPEKADYSAKFADQMTFEGFQP